MNIVEKIMNEFEKSLILKDICGRIKYHVKCQVTFKTTTGDVKILDMLLESMSAYGKGYFVSETDIVYSYDYKPYLRPLSSMTDEERDKYRKAYEKDFAILEDSLGAPITYTYTDGTVLRDRPVFNEIDWLTANHFDYRGLIPMGLALEAPEGMY